MNHKSQKHKFPNQLTSWLCSPVFNAGALDKAIQIGADVIIFDLEDSVPEHRKAEARMSLKGRVDVHEAITTAIRINSLSTTDGLKDLIFLIEENIRPDIIILPKVNLESHLDVLSNCIRAAGARAQVFAVIETMQAFQQFRTMRVQHSALAGVIFGAADFSADLGVDVMHDDYDYLRIELVLAARTLGLAVVDSPCLDLNNADVLRAQSKFAKGKGFDGKIAIHPAQVKVINDCFETSEAEMSAAQAILDLHAEIAKKGISRLDSQMIGPPVIRYAEKVLSQALGKSQAQGL